MRKAIKCKGRIANAYELGSESDTELKLIASGKIRKHADGKYEVFSLESVNGAGEIAENGDFFKVDSMGYPYPIAKTYFLKNHSHLEGDLYEQFAKPLYAWTDEDGMCDEIRFLIEHKGLVIDETSPHKYFTAPLYGTLESAARSAVIVFYELYRDEAGNIVDATFNFVEKNEFMRTYEWIDA